MKLLKKRAAIKSIGGIVLLLVIFFAVVSVIGFNSFTEALLSQYSEGAFLTAETAARILDADRMAERVRNTWKFGISWTSCAILPARPSSM